MEAKLLKIIALWMMLGISLVSWSNPGRNDQAPALKNVIVDPGHGGQDGGARGSMSREAVLALEISLRVRDMLKAELPELNVMMTRESDVLPGNLSSINAALKWRADYANNNGGDLFISVHLNASPANQKYGRRQIGTEEKKYYVWSGKGKSRKKVWKTKTVPTYERYRLPATVRGTQTYILARDWYNSKVNNVSKSSEVYEGGETDSLGQDMLQMDPVEARIRASQYTKYFFQKSLNLATYVEEEFARAGRYSWGVQQRDWQGIWVLQATQMPSILVEAGFIDNPAEEQYLASELGQEETARCIVNAVKRYREMLSNPNKAIQTGATTEATVPAANQ